MTQRSPLITLNNGVDMPALGLGVLGRDTPELVTGAVETAIITGYRLIDTAASYGNERQVGEGIARSGVPRSDLFVTTKLWMAAYGFDEALRAFNASLKKLGLDYVDLYLLHYPTPRYFDSTVAAYKAAERLLKEKRVRAIGVSNFGAAHLKRLIDRTEVVPAVNQIEIHPYFPQQEMREANARLGIVTQAWSPIGGIFINHPRDSKAIVYLLKDPALGRIAEKYGRTPAQVVLRWHIQNGVAVIPKSVHLDRIAGNIAVFDFELNPADVDAIAKLDRNLRGGRDPETFDMDAMRTRAAASKS